MLWSPTMYCEMSRSFSNEMKSKRLAFSHNLTLGPVSSGQPAASNMGGAKGQKATKGTNTCKHTDLQYQIPSALSAMH